MLVDPTCLKAAKRTGRGLQIMHLDANEEDSLIVDARSQIDKAVSLPQVFIGREGWQVISFVLAGGPAAGQ